MILEFITGLSFGHVTLACITLVVALLAISIVEWVALVLVKVLLNADHPDAPDVGWALKTTTLLTKILRLREPKFHKETGKWYVESFWGFVDKGGKEWSSFKHSEYFLQTTKEEAEELMKYIDFKVSVGDTLYPLVLVLLLDLSIYLLQLAFLPTLSILVTVATIWGVRKLAGMVYSNSKNIGTHGDRITKLEDK